MKKNIFQRIFSTVSSHRFLLSIFFFSFFSIRYSSAQCGPVISTFPYTEDFEATQAWTSGGTNSSWAWGIPSHPVISSAGGGTRSWCSGGLTGSSYSGAQQSWIMSPCFDFTTLNYPWISFKIFWECEYQWDGMCLQYSLNGGTTWANVGAANDPVNCLNANWFNHSNISNLSQASPKHGWCGRIGPTAGACSGGNGSGTWLTAKHCMANLANQPSVRFRFLFGSGTTCNAYDGTAIDDILIQDAPPNVANFSYACSGLNVASFTNLSAQCPTSYSWNFGDPASGGANISTLANPTHTFSAPGNYTVSLTASGPCNASSTTLIPISILSVTTAVTHLNCNGAANGSSTVTVGGGTPGYSYTWMPTGGNASVAVGLPAGVYTVAVKDNGSCITKVTTSINQPPAMSAVISATHVSCHGLSDGALSGNASQGTAPYSYTWQPMNTASSSITNLPANTYTLYVKDANTCTAAFTGTVTQPAVLNAGLTVFSVTCHGASNGALQALVTGGTPLYTYSWNPAPGNTSSVPGLSAGNYTVYVKDSHNCTTTATAAVSQPVLPVSGSILTATPTCGLPNGSATVTAAGGTPGYSYGWSPAGGNQPVATGLAGGTYSVTIADNNHCSLTLTVSIALSQSLSVSTTLNHATCFGLSNGSAGAAVSGGIPPYTYTWSLASGASQPGPSFHTGLSAGSYSLLVEDANNCLASRQFFISSPQPLNILKTVGNVSCYGGTDGSITYSAVGGMPGYVFYCQPFGTITAPLVNLPAGNYSVQVKDNNNCVTQDVIQVPQPAAPLSVVISGTNISCHGSFDGGAKAQVNGGTPGYVYTWAPAGGPAAEIHGLPANTYTLLIKDLNGCTLTAVKSLTQPALPLTLSAVIKTVTCFGLNNGAATITPQGGTPGYNMSWPSISTALAPKEYNVQVKDQHNCAASLTFAIAEPPPIDVQSEASKFCSGQPGTLSTTVTGGVPPLDYNWNGVQSSSGMISVTHTATTVYTVVVTDAKGCQSGQNKIPVEIPPPLQLITVPTVSVCEGQQTVFTATASGGDENYSFTWYPGPMRGPSHLVVPESGQLYTVSVTDGCASTRSAPVKLVFHQVPSAQLTFSKTETCLPVCVSFTSSIFPSSELKSYTWEFGDFKSSEEASPLHCYKIPGEFIVRARYVTVNGCEGVETMTKTVQVDPLPVADFKMDDEELSAYYPVVNLTNLSRNAAKYNWYFNDGTVSDEENPSHVFQGTGEQQIYLVVENELGCKDTVMKKVEVSQEFTFFAPNAFTPDQDRVNDVFLPKGLGWNTGKYELVIYDRWGHLLFETKDHEQGWDGKAPGADKVVQNGVYVWRVKLYDVFNKFHEFTGHVLIE